MGWEFMKANDTISGKEGELYATIDGKVRMVAECKSIDAKITKNKTEFKSLGQRGTQHKAIGWSGTGTLVIHYATSFWAKMMIQYAKTGEDIYFNLQIINSDPSNKAKIGSQKITLSDVNMDEAEIAKLDVDADFLDQSMNFSFSGVDMTEEFKQ